MSIITAIEVQKNRGKRRSIFVDGEFVAGVHEDVAAALKLDVGQSFDRQRLIELLRTETVRKARERALRLIRYRDRSVSEIRRRLVGSDFPEDIVEEVIDELTRVGLLDDRKFSRDWVTSRTAAKPMGKTRLAFELGSRGVEAPIVEEALEGLDPEAEYKLARSTAETRLIKMDRGDPTVRNKLGSFLSRRGFDWDVIVRVLDELVPER
ncbi:MAG: regulatory protein RecX [Armatimonadota bacterium]